MPILHRVKVVCDRCGKHTECYARVTHDGEPEYDSYKGYGPLAASDVEHAYELPDGWEVRLGLAGNIVVCPDHEANYDTRVLRRVQ